MIYTETSKPPADVKIYTVNSKYIKKLGRVLPNINTDITKNPRHTKQVLCKISWSFTQIININSRFASINDVQQVISLLDRYCPIFMVYKLFSGWYVSLSLQIMIVCISISLRKKQQ